MSWKVKNYNINANKIEDYDIFQHYGTIINKIKKEFSNKEDFSKALNSQIMWQYWSRAEYELIIEIDENKNIWLISWCGCRNPEEVKINVTNDSSFDWKTFAEFHISEQIYKNYAKIDIYDQIRFKWDEFVDYCYGENV